MLSKPRKQIKKLLPAFLTTNQGKNMNTGIIAPAHYCLMEPLIKWKILSLDHLGEATYADNRRSNFYKIISQLEERGLIEGFVDSYSKGKYVYLTKAGLEAMGAKIMTPINPENKFHDSIVSENAFHFRNFPFTKKVLIEHEIVAEYPMIGHRPDTFIVGHHKGDFRMAMEVELTIKSKERILDTFSFYHQSQFFNNVLYIFGQKNVYETYIRALNENTLGLDKNKFLFIHMDNLYRRKYNTFTSEVYVNGAVTTLGKLFEMEKYQKETLVEQMGNDSVMSSN